MSNNILIYSGLGVVSLIGAFFANKYGVFDESEKEVEPDTKQEIDLPVSEPQPEINIELPVSEPQPEIKKNPRKKTAKKRLPRRKSSFMY